MKAETVLLVAAALLVVLALAVVAWQRARSGDGEGGESALGTWAADDPQLGRRAYALCLGCHGPEGRGIAGYAPPLAQAPWLNGDPRAAVLITLHGFDATTEPGAPYYSSRMSGFHDRLADHEIAALLSWARQQWGNRAPPVERSLVGELRRRFAGRDRPWSPAELRAVVAAP
ncbi:MAG: cytochrome c [Planctomycetota bacterium]|nr:c-type cytochrome [Planctomycetota bacterium]MDW8373490.1 cytochrome c [Planctomycetota bacterium]